MKYTAGTIFKAAGAALTAALAAATAAANGPDLSVLDIGQWLLAIGTGLGAGGALLHQPAKTDPVASAVSTIQDVTEQLSKSHESLTQQAVDSVKAVQDAVGAIVPGGVLGSLAEQVIAAAARSAS